jgi:hypothetical protein
MTCPDCEYNKARAANWRAEAYRLGGHDYIPRLWVGLTDEYLDELVMNYGYDADDECMREMLKEIEAKLKEKNT